MTYFIYVMLHCNIIYFFATVMNKKILYIVPVTIVAVIIMLFLLKKSVLEPWVKGRIESAINESAGQYIVTIDSIHILALRSGIEFINISVSSKPDSEGKLNLAGEIGSLKLTGISLVNAIFRKAYYINEITILNSHLTGTVSPSKDPENGTVSPANFRVNNLLFDGIFLEITKAESAQSWLLAEGYLELKDLQIEELDSLTPALMGNLEFYAGRFVTVSADSMYTYSARDVNYSDSLKILTADTFYLQPNFSDYEFASRHQFETDRFEALFNNVSFHGFSADDFMTHGSLVSSFIEIGELSLDIFRDKRKEFKHENKPLLQDLIYNYPGKMHIDSIAISGGDITYREHAENADGYGVIKFNDFNALVYKVSNDVIYKTEEAFMEIMAGAMLMDRGKVTLNFKGKIFENQNTFSLNGSLSAMDASALNPILENNASIFVRSGRIDRMNFSLTANNSKATGIMNLLYHDLNIEVTNAEGNTGLKERFVTFIANLAVINKNPGRGQEVREGIIDFERDSERSIFNYWVKSILSGVTSSLLIYDFTG
jgi:hypothetical protein